MGNQQGNRQGRPGKVTGFDQRGFDRDRGKLVKTHKNRDLEKRRSNTEKYSTPHIVLLFVVKQKFMTLWLNTIINFSTLSSLLH